jgi:hypothetical protein
MPATVQKVVQIATETTWGTPVAATAKLMGVTDASIQIVDEVEVVAEVGRSGPSARAVQKAQHGTGSLTMAASYEDLAYLADMLFGTAAPGAATTYTRSYAAPTTAGATIPLRTIEYGTSGASYRLEGALLESLTVSGEAGGYWTAQAGFIGEAVATVSLAALSERTVELIRTADTVLTVDAAGGTIGTTAVPATLISFELSVTPGRHLKTFAGSLNPSGYGDSAWEIGLRTTLEFNASAKAYVDAILSGLVERQIRIRATSGTKVSTIDFAGVVMDGATLFSDRDGNMTVDLTWAGKYNTQLANSLLMALTAGVQTLA